MGFRSCLQDLDSGHHGSGFPLPPFRQALLARHLAAQEAAGLLRKSSKKKSSSAPEKPPDPEGAQTPCTPPDACSDLPEQCLI